MIKLSMDFEWSPILEEELRQYLFPHKVTSYMRLKYQIPAIYRWVVENDKAVESAYIGETEQLCPRRVYGYLNPGPSQMTNLRINNLFNELLTKGRSIKLEHLLINDFCLNEKKITSNDLTSKNIRVLLESIMLAEYEKDGISLLNQAIKSK